MVQRHSVVIPKGDGGVEVYPLKEWLRQNPNVVPLDPSSTTSHQLRNALRHVGWTMQETPSEIRLIKPGTETDAVVVNQILGSDEQDEMSADEAWFTLEYQLRDFLASNLGSVPVNGHRLRLFVSPDGRDGVEYPSAVGPIDILAIDESGAFFVFELKRANSPDRALGQLARYMGWVAQTIGKEKEVFGVIVAKAISENLRYAVSVMPNVSLYEYEVSFRLRPAQDIKAS